MSLSTKKRIVFYTLKYKILCYSICTFLFLLHLSVFSDNMSHSDADKKLLDDFILSKGYDNTICFDSTNIKQYWTNATVLSKDNSIIIRLPNTSASLNESVPLTIQLVNVNEIQKCTIDVIADDSDFFFHVLNSKLERLSESSAKSDFVQYHIASSSFNLEKAYSSNTPLYFSFCLKFFSNSKESISIKKIVLSFSQAQDSVFLGPFGKLFIDSGNSQVLYKGKATKDFFGATGTSSQVFSKNNILVGDNEISSSVTIKNVGENATNVFVGYAIYTRDRVRLDSRNFPFQNINAILHVLSADIGSKTIIVDTYSNWAKNAYLALNAKEDLSDVPNNSFVEGTIDSIKQLPNGQAEITLSKPITSSIEKGTCVRIHGVAGAYLYTGSKRGLQPNEEVSFSSTIKKDDNFLRYSSDALPRGVYYVTPVILSYSDDPTKENTIMIRDYSVQY